jgi:hypothetical protein
MVDVLDVRSGGAGVDVLLAVAGYESDSRSAADRVADAGWRLLETAQDEIAEATTDPWPHQGSGTLPEPCAGAARENLRSVSTCAKPMMRYFLLEYGRPACRRLRVDDDAASYGGMSGCDRPTTGEAAISTSCEVPVIGLDGLGGCPTGLRPTPGSRA